MKHITLILLAVFSMNLSFAQKESTYKADIKVIEITGDVNIHFRSPEPVQFVDISTDVLQGDLPIENVVRIKVQHNTIIKDSLVNLQNLALGGYVDEQELGIVTIVGQSFMAQYRIIYRDMAYSSNVVTSIEITPENMKPLEFPSYEMPNTELKAVSMDIIKMKKVKKPKRKSKKLKMVAALNNIYTVGDYVFLDLSFYNKTNLSYDIDDIQFTIDDKKLVKSTNVQSNKILPIYKLYNNKNFKKSYRNVFVFKKFTYPDNKLLNIRLTEEQISGRTIILGIKYKDILQADTL